ncbi:hypothetical protein NQ318_006099 [Aromia moschata]|uniref:Mitochondrial ribosomal protein S34 n=1 Tax=Aromia moschata TaxID=1265417 RepID=A0AAV8Z4S8_9CUCU|nr:hypothetical protein NQ318_006099 [Aromia moschata]
MPYKYIGRTTDFKGKTLWEIVGNLKNFGVGRIVARNRMERYPEPCYMKILKVETLPNPEVVTLDNLRKVRVWVERTFRGKTDPQPVVIESASYKADYKLIPKDEEEDYCRIVRKLEGGILPKTIEFPPILKELILRDAGAKEGTTEEPRLELVYNRKSLRNRYRIAEDGEQPTVNFTMGLGKPVSPSLYEGIKLDQ